MARVRFTLLPRWPPPPTDVEGRIVGHLERWVETKAVQRGLEVGRMSDKGWGWAFNRWLVARLDEAQPDWRDYYTYDREHISRDDERWLSETTIATGHARVALADWRTPPDKRDEAERLIADAKEEA